MSLDGSFIHVAHYKDPEEELIQVCRQIKKRIVDEGMEPGEIAIVLNNFSRAVLPKGKNFLGSNVHVVKDSGGRQKAVLGS